ncbi:hypothetical protein FA10DRAFT_300027 [Acaromyces ingoldii]|uniref:UBR-type domain-containing protein n=1 Tax=Acaromyces ingoldii TaxID=215250 RepID=A0A316YTQ9_9BASI|nr:hypothetical protein FA10DRAFT_300027 [Acaromyces ingoldii]PWN91413.1 hypothetical protein FA10DRAFT_300027 [Acaromyces ingoldii]
MSSPSALPDPSLPAPPLAEQDEGFTAEQLIQRQAQLEREAREAVPFSFTKGGCTYEKGYIRQPVYACRTCGGGGVCAGCSVGCHADHDLVELFAKRNFRCDCGTLSIQRGSAGGQNKQKPSPCNLRPSPLSFAPENDDNVYTANFEGRFCYCKRGESYNPETEEETMFQCLVCEDWLHESCTSLRPTLSRPGDGREDQAADGPLLDHDSFDLFICDTCVRKPECTVLRDYIGARGWAVCLPTNANELPKEWDGLPARDVVAAVAGWEMPYRIMGLNDGNASVPDTSSMGDAAEGESASKPDRMGDHAEAATGSKRPAISEDEDLLASKRARLGDCIRPEGLKNLQGRLDVFLEEQFRARICRCSECLPKFAAIPFVLEAEDTYNPPQSQAVSEIGDHESEGGASQTSSTYDLGLAALNRLPREQMINSLEAYNHLRDALFQHLRPFAAEGRVVDEESVRDFFRKQREGK